MKTKTLLLFILTELSILFGCSSCTLSITPDGRPTLGIDPVAAVIAYNSYTSKRGLPPVAVTETTVIIQPTK